MFYVGFCVIFWGVIDEYDMIVGVVLHKYWVEVSQVESSFHILIGGYNNAERQLFFELIDFVGFLEILGLLVD